MHLEAKWDARTARLRALGAMHGTARKMVRRIDLELPEDGSQPEPVKDLLDAYEEVFQPPLAREYLLEEFRAAVQREEETVVAFSARVADTFVRLYPDRADNADKDEQLYHVFKEGLRIPEVQNRVRDGEYKSLTDMVAAAQRAEVNVAKNIQKETGILPRNLAIEKAICAMSAKQGPSPAQFSGKCFICSAAALQDIEQQTARWRFRSTSTGAKKAAASPRGGTAASSPRGKGPATPHPARRRETEAAEVGDGKTSVGTSSRHQHRRRRRRQGPPAAAEGKDHHRAAQHRCRAKA